MVYNEERDKNANISYNNVKSNPYNKKTHMSVDNGYRNRNNEKMSTQEIKAVVDQQIKNYEANDEHYLEADEYKQQLDQYIKKYKANEAVLKGNTPKNNTKKESIDQYNQRLNSGNQKESNNT